VKRPVGREPVVPRFVDAYIGGKSFAHVGPENARATPGVQKRTPAGVSAVQCANYHSVNRITARAATEPRAGFDVGPASQCAPRHELTNVCSGILNDDINSLTRIAGEQS
jgi:hypothetical protein